MSFLVNPYWYVDASYSNTYSMNFTKANSTVLYINNKSNSIDTAMRDTTPNISISMWIKFSSTTDSVQTSFFSKFLDFAGYDRNMIMWKFASNKIGWYGQYNSSSQCLNISTTNTYTSADGWIHLCFVYDCTKTVSTDIAKIYVNGVEQGYTGTVSTTNKYFHNQVTESNRANIAIGTRFSSSSPGGGIEFLGGKVDDFTFWDKSLSSAEVSELYNSGQPKDVSEMTSYSTNCLAWYRMGDDPSDNWDGTNWNITNVKGTANTDLVSLNMNSSDRTTDVY